MRLIPRVGLEFGHSLRWRPSVEADLGRTSELRMLVFVRRRVRVVIVRSARGRVIGEPIADGYMVHDALARRHGSRSLDSYR